MDSRTTLQNLPPDQYLALQLILQCIHRLNTLDQRFDMLDRRLDVLDHGVREAMQEIRSVKDPVCNYQSGFTMEHSGGRDSTVDFQAGVNDLNAITSFGSSHDSQIMLQPAALHGTSSGVIGSLSGGTTGLLPYGARNSPMHSGGRDSIVDSQAGLNSLNAIPPSMSSHDPYLVPQSAPHELLSGVTGSVLEGTDGLLLNGARGFANNVTHQHSIYSEGFTASYDMEVTESSSEGVGARFDVYNVSIDLSLDVDGTSDPVREPAGQSAARQLGSVVQTGRAKVKVGRPKVKCPWDKCPKFISKDVLSRHINEVHEKKIVAGPFGNRSVWFSLETEKRRSEMHQIPVTLQANCGYIALHANMEIGAEKEMYGSLQACEFPIRPRCGTLELGRRSDVLVSI
ncbi:uncharacterized protein F5147DRAFT_657599 [Suillus discolor]|uniref:Uncharacterized protein n=1 Tax=Suillus discolor TaxID=1912936 RepID=A0A9P7EVM0_9AGAM|nr:uncharacterized protein F5147DRAFT_657599 [Suillus discolor]KAG2092822.1 hypothetical protein F5147DRAFT_657599 [Suillus discolor]